MTFSLSNSLVERDTFWYGRVERVANYIGNLYLNLQNFYVIKLSKALPTIAPFEFFECIGPLTGTYKAKKLHFAAERC